MKMQTKFRARNKKLVSREYSIDAKFTQFLSENVHIQIVMEFQTCVQSNEIVRKFIAVAKKHVSRPHISVHEKLPRQSRVISAPIG